MKGHSFGEYAQMKQRMFERQHYFIIPIPITFQMLLLTNNHKLKAIQIYVLS